MTARAYDAIAALAEEREGAGHDGVQAVEQVFLQKAARPEKARLDGLRQDFEQLRGFMHAQLLDRTQHEDRAKLRRQRVDRRFEQRAQLLVGDLLLG